MKSCENCVFFREVGNYCFMWSVEVDSVERVCQRYSSMTDDTDDNKHRVLVQVNLVTRTTTVNRLWKIAEQQTEANR